jgi:tRNA uridine 5-carbamoylmethylation protein Kti12
MDIILLSGNSNSGKTTTMNLVYDELAKKGATVIQQKRQLGGNPADFECVLKYKGKLIGIYSMGDYLIHCCFAVVQYAFCDKLILAYSNKFKQDLSAVVANCQNHTVINKSYGNPASENQTDAAVLISKI